MKRTLPIILTFFFGLAMVLGDFIPHHKYRAMTAEFLEWGLILAAAAYLLGIVNLLQVNVPRVLRRERDWGYKLVMLLCFAGTVIFGFLEGEQRQEPGAIYKWIYDSAFTPLSSTMFALLAFYIASAAFRAFRARNLEAGILLVTAMVVMIGRVPVGEWISADLPHFVNWIMDVPNTAAKRAIYIGGALGAISTGLRVILGLERSHLGD